MKDYGLKPSEVLGSKDIPPIVPGLYQGRVVAVEASLLRVQIPDIDGGTVDDVSLLPPAYPIFNSGELNLFSVGNVVIVGVMVVDEFRTVLGIKGAGNNLKGEISGFVNEGGDGFQVDDTPDNRQLTITSGGFSVVLRQDTGDAIKRGVLITTPHGNKVEIDENSDDAREHTLNLSVNGGVAVDATQNVAITVDAGDYLKAGDNAASLDIIVKGVDPNIDPPEDMFTQLTLDSYGEAKLNTTSNIEIESAKVIKLVGKKVEIVAPVEIKDGHELTIYDEEFPIVLNSHTHPVSVGTVGTVPEPPHTHLQSVAEKPSAPPI